MFDYFTLQLKIRVFLFRKNDKQLKKSLTLYKYGVWHAFMKHAGTGKKQKANSTCSAPDWKNVTCSGAPPPPILGAGSAKWRLLFWRVSYCIAPMLYRVSLQIHHVYCQTPQFARLGTLRWPNCVAVHLGQHDRGQQNGAPELTDCNALVCVWDGKKASRNWAREKERSKETTIEHNPTYHPPPISRGSKKQSNLNLFGPHTVT